MQSIGLVRCVLSFARPSPSVLFFLTAEEEMSIKLKKCLDFKDLHTLSPEKCAMFHAFICLRCYQLLRIYRYTRRLIIQTQRGPLRSLNNQESKITQLARNVFISQKPWKACMPMLACDLVSVYFELCHVIATDRQKYIRHMHWISIPWHLEQWLTTLWQPNNCGFICNSHCPAFSSLYCQPHRRWHRRWSSKNSQ